LGGHRNEDPLIVSFEHVSIRPFTFLALKKNIHLDLSVFLSGLIVVDVTFAIQIGDDNDSFFVMVIIQEPSAPY
jgi:hypothetical protein